MYCMVCQKCNQPTVVSIVKQITLIAVSKHDMKICT